MVWLGVAIAILILLVAANKKEKAHTCKDVVITIKGVGENMFIDKGDIITLLKRGSNEKLIGKSVMKMDLAAMERQLEKSSWISDAELYFDSHDVLHVTATERQPIARIFTRAGTSFYIDSFSRRMPLLQKLSVRVPVVTGFPSAKKLNGSDSLLLGEVKKLALFVITDSFWNAQVGQIDIVGNKNFEIIPTVGNHIIQLGTTENLEQKFNKLFVFYNQVLRKTGFDKYSVINVQYDQQVVGRYKGATSVVDSIQLQKNIQELMVRSAEAREAQMPMTIDSLNNEITINGFKQDSVGGKETIEKPSVLASGIMKTISKPKPALKKGATVAKPVVTKNDVKKPKAVMKKKASP